MTMLTIQFCKIQYHVSFRTELDFLQTEMISLSENNNKNGTAASYDEGDSNTEYEDINVEIASQKAERLECTVAVLEAEVSHLSSTILDFEQNTIRLEQENGRLLAESLMVYRKFNLSWST